jgi:hypothetical protein
MAKLLSAMGQHNWLRRRAIHKLVTHPTALARLLAVHGDIALTAIKIREIAGLFWRQLRFNIRTPRAMREVP